MGSVPGKDVHILHNNSTTKDDNNSSENKPCLLRRARHAGSWYDQDPVALQRTLTGFLSAAAAAFVPPPSTQLRALVVPHAGYSYSGPTAAFAYQSLVHALQQPSCHVRTILVLHPSHHLPLAGCAVSAAIRLQTPLGDLVVDDELRQTIRNSPLAPFSVMTIRDDEKEHSGELQYPFLAKVLRDARRDDITVLPVMCGALTVQQEMVYGTALAEIVRRPSVLTVVSTDFCHWGARFSYQPVPDEQDTMPIHQFIEQMDRRGMNLIELQQPGAFVDYLKETHNTICGRHAVSVWLHAVTATKDAENALNVKFVRYAQSSAVSSIMDSSVSYAAAVATL